MSWTDWLLNYFRTDIYINLWSNETNLALPRPELPPPSPTDSSHTLPPLSQETSPLVRLSFLLWHSHTNIPPVLFASPRSRSAHPFPLLFCPPLEGDWKVYQSNSFEIFYRNLHLEPGTDPPSFTNDDVSAENKGSRLGSVTQQSLQQSMDGNAQQ